MKAMLKEIIIVILTIGSIFLLVPLFWVFPFEGFKEFVFTLCLVVVLIVYSAFDVKRLLNNKQRNIALSFVIILTAAIVLSYYIVFQIMPIIGPKLYI
jgi:membrane protein CcdC involved in cytochrome C biogenesis